MYVWIITSYLWMDLSRAFLQEPFLEAINETLPLFLEYHFPKPMLPHPRYSSSNRFQNLDCFYSTPTGCFHTLALFLKTIKLEHWQVVIIKPYDIFFMLSLHLFLWLTCLKTSFEWWIRVPYASKIPSILVWYDCFISKMYTITSSICFSLCEGDIFNRHLLP